MDNSVQEKHISFVCSPHHLFFFLFPPFSFSLFIPSIFTLLCPLNFLSELFCLSDIINKEKGFHTHNTPIYVNMNANILWMVMHFTWRKKRELFYVHHQDGRTANPTNKGCWVGPYLENQGKLSSDATPTSSISLPRVHCQFITCDCFSVCLLFFLI